MKTTTYDGHDPLASMMYKGWKFSICADIDNQGYPVNVWAEALPEGSSMPFNHNNEDTWCAIEREFPTGDLVTIWHIEGELKKQAATTIKKLQMLADQSSPFGKEYEPAK